MSGLTGTGRWIAVCTAATAVAVSCGTNTSAPSSAAGRKLAAKVIEAPPGYAIEKIPGANGQISPALFRSFGGVSPALSKAFVAGFRGNYVNQNSPEGLSITVLEFRSAADANRYLQATATKTLSFASATYQPYAGIPGATEADGTQAYAGNYDHGVVMSRGVYYAQVVYATNVSAEVPVEFSSWIKAQYASLT